MQSQMAGSLPFAILRLTGVTCEATCQLQCKFNKWEAMLHRQHCFPYLWGAYCPNFTVATCPSDLPIRTFLSCHDITRKQVYVSS